MSRLSPALRPSLGALLALSLVASLAGCAEAPLEPAPDRPTDATAETALILEVLNRETRDALSRDYAGWREHWVQEPYVTKTYVNVTDGTGSETRGWDEVDRLVRTYIEEHPEPEPLPTPLADAEVRLYGTGATVTYEQNDADQGRKREYRLMEKVGGEWRIAGMHTTIYGPDETE